MYSLISSFDLINISNIFDFTIIISLFPEYCLNINYLITLFFLVVIIIASLWIIRKATILRKISDLNQQLIKQVNDKIDAEKKVLELQAKIESQVLKRTAALGLANHDLKESAILMEKVANLTPNVLSIYDLEKKYNVYANRFVGEILGYSPQEIEEMNVQLFDKLIHPEDLNLIEQHHQKCLTLGQDKYLELEYRMKDRFGKWHWLHSKDTVFERNEVGKPTQILGITQDISKTKQIQQKSALLNQQLAEKVATLETWHEQRMKLGQMNEFLQACIAIEEAQPVLSDLLPKLFPQTHGVVYLTNNSNNSLNAIAAWGLPHSGNHFEPDQCWALRRSNAHIVNSAVCDLYCTHTEHKSCLTSTLCQPMIAKGKTLGMLYLRFDNSDEVNELVQELAETVAQNIAMSFANLTLQKELRYQSLRDPLTGLFNRRYLQESLEKELDRANRKQQFVGLMMLDIDHFKRFNDTYGHSAGDYVLQMVANYLISETRHYDIVCRYGGEELILVMPDASIENIIVRAEEIRSRINRLQLQHDGKNLESVSVSIGISCFPDDSTKADDLIRVADKALYAAKEAGRNCVKRC